MARADLAAGDMTLPADLQANRPAAVRRGPYIRRRMTAATWELEPCSYEDVRALAAALDLDEVTATVLVRRGYTDPDEARRFLDGALPGHDPFLLGDMHDAVETIVAAVDAGARICVHGD